MKKRLKINKLSPIILSTVLIASTVSIGEAQAASKYKLKNGVLVVSKTEKKASGYATYKSTLYSNGKKFTGTYKGAYYTSGMKRVATGAYKNAYYVKGIKKVTTGIYNSKYYKNGRLSSGLYKGAYYVSGDRKVKTGTYKNAYYVNGVKKVTSGLYGGKYYKNGRKATGTYNGAYYVGGTKKVTTGTYNGSYYLNDISRVKTGVYNGALYINGVVNSGYRLYKGNLYKDKVFNKGYALFEEQLYLDEKLNIGYALHKNQLYNDDAMNSGYAEFKDQLYLDEQLNEEIMLFEDRLFNGASLNKGYLLFEDQLYNGPTLNEGLTLFAVDGQDFYYSDGDLAEGLFEVEGKEEAFEKGIKQPAKVLDIEVANSKQIKVTFNKSIDEKTLTQETLKVVEAKNAVKPIVLNYKLSTDKQVATITFSNVLAGDYIVKVLSGIKTIGSEQVATQTKNIEIDDKVAPTFTKFTQEGIRTFQFHFSELLEERGTIVVKRVDGTIMQSSDYQLTMADEYIQIVFSNNIEVGKNIHVEFSGQKDAANNVLVGTATSIVQAGQKNGILPEVKKITPVNARQFTIEFSEEVLGFDSADLTVAGTTVKSVTKKAKPTEYTIDLDKGITGEVLIAIRDSEPAGSTTTAAYTDVAGDPGKAYSEKILFDTDIIAPKVTAKVLKDSNGDEYMELEVDEDVDVSPTKVMLPTTATLGGVPTVGTVSFNKIDMMKSPVSGGKVKFTLPLSKTTFTADQGTATPLVKGTSYTMSLPANIFRDATGNMNEEKLQLISSFVRGDDRNTATPEVASIKASTTNNSQIIVEFKNTADLDNASLVNKANYQVNGSAVSAVEMQSSHRVVVTLPKNSISTSGNYSVGISGISADGDPTRVMANYTNTLDLIENKSPIFSNAKAISKTAAVAGVYPSVSKVTVVYGLLPSERIDVTYGGYENTSAKPIIVIYNKALNKFEYAPTSAVVVGLEVTPKTGLTIDYVDKETYSINLSGGNPGEGYSPGETKVQVTFNEAVKAPIGTVYKVKIGQDVIMNVDAVVTAYNSSSHTVTFTINKELKVADFAKKVSIIADSQPITDEAGNAVEEGQGIEINGTGL